MERIEQVARPVLAEHSAELVDLQFVHEQGQWVLRFFLDKEGGITLDDCAEISDHLGRLLDATNLVSRSYSLEVSSPGINRRLRKEKDYQRFMGERVDVTVFAPINGRRHFRGTIQAVHEGVVEIQEPSQPPWALPLTAIAKAKLDPEWKI